ncbi:MAG: hypothetical protein EHM32_08370 [Spirochaetales bacterium]|nr:MAG: hypothetical protein EHM32_08370 [Spirochaetales bacterium]
MADFIDFLAIALNDKTEKKLVTEFVEIMKPSSAEAIEKWFKRKGYEDISLEDCKRIAANRENVVHTGDVSLKGNY